MSMMETSGQYTLRHQRVQVVRGIVSLFVRLLFGASITRILISNQLLVLPHSASIGFGLEMHQLLFCRIP